MKQYICILANNMSYLSMLMSNLPDNLLDANYIIFTDTRVHDNRDIIRDIMKGRRFIMVDDTLVNKRFSSSVIDNEFVYDYSMSMNILMQWYVFKFIDDAEEVLFLDDDVLLTSNLKSLLDSATHSMFASDYLRAVSDNRTTGKAREVFMAILDTCDLVHDKIEWYKKSFNGGQFIIMKKEFNIDAYEKCLKKFFSCELIYTTWKNRRVHTTAYLDERFISAFMIAEGISNLDMQLDVKILNQACSSYKDITLINAYKKKSILHVCNGQHKVNTFNRIIDLCCKGVSDENFN